MKLNSESTLIPKWQGQRAGGLGEKKDEWAINKEHIKHLRI